MALIAAHLNAGHSGGDSVAIGIYSPSSPTSIPSPPPPPFSPSLISLMVSVDVKHHVYLRTYMLLEERRYKPMLGVWGLGGVAPAVGELWVGVGVG